MSRAYRSVRSKANRVYSVEDVLALYGICRNTLSNWIQTGLCPIDENRPQLFRGSALNWFHEQRSLKTRRPLRMGEFNCWSCKGRMFPDVASLTFEGSSNGAHWVMGACPECGRRLHKILGGTEYDKLCECMESNTALHTVDEENGAVPGGIGTKSGQTCPSWTPENERIIFEYQIYAGRFDPKTLDALLAAIRDFEAFHGSKPLSAITPKDANSYRQHLIAEGKAGLSRSTVLHRASYLTAFFEWLVVQNGDRRMNQTIGGYFRLPKAQAANALQPAPRAIPTTDEVKKLISSMPIDTWVQRRDRAIVAASFLFGTRANATASLRLGLVDVDARKVRQDASIVRIKNGKDQITFWFPLGEFFETIIIEWIEELQGWGCGAEDALFPPDAHLVSPYRLSSPNRLPIKQWDTDGSVRRAFQRACTAAGLAYFNPHSIRHYLKAVRDDYCKTADQRRAWSDTKSERL